MSEEIDKANKYYGIKGQIVDLNGVPICNKACLQIVSTGFDFVDKKRYESPKEIYFNQPSMTSRKPCSEGEQLKVYFERQYMKKRLLEVLEFYGMDVKTRDILWMLSPIEYPTNESEAIKFCQKILEKNPFHQTRKYSLYHWIMHILHGSGGLNGKRVVIRRYGKNWQTDLDTGYFFYSDKYNPTQHVAVKVWNASYSLNEASLCNNISTNITMTTSITSALTVTNWVSAPSSTDNEIETNL